MIIIVLWALICLFAIIYVVSLLNKKLKRIDSTESAQDAIKEKLRNMENDAKFYKELNLPKELLDSLNKNRKLVKNYLKEKK